MTNRDRYKEAELGRSPQLNFRATPTDGMRFPQRHSLCDWLEKKKLQRCDLSSPLEHRCHNIKVSECD